MEFGKKKFCEIDLFDFTNFFGLDFFKFSGRLCDDESNKMFEINFYSFKFFLSSHKYDSVPRITLAELLFINSSVSGVFGKLRNI